MPGPRVTVVGAGIAGLATAFRIEEALRRTGVGGRVRVFEAGPSVGGNIRSESLEGFTVEWGPNGFLDNVPASLALVRDVGLDGEVQKADPRAAIRYLWRKGRLHRLPSGPVSFLKSGVLSPAGRLRLLLEPLQPKGAVDEDESVRSFGVRRIGREATDVLVDAMVSGVFAGDASTLSLPSAFPKMRAMEAEHGGLFRAMLARRRQGSGGGPAGPGGTLTSFRDGMEALPRRLASRLDGDVRLSCSIATLRRAPDDAWTVRTEDGEEHHADHVVLAVPAPAAERLFRDQDPELAHGLVSMPTAGLAVVALGYAESDLAQAPDGFGFLVPRSEGLRMLGCLRDSTIFPGRAPRGRVLLRVMIGGAHDPEAVELSDDALLETVTSELRQTLAIEVAPILSRIVRHPLGIGQYTLGHQERLDRIDEALRRLPGLSLTGSSYRGVSMNSCIEDAEVVARTVADRLAVRSPASSSPSPAH